MATLNATLRVLHFVAMSQDTAQAQHSTATGGFYPLMSCYLLYMGAMFPAAPYSLCFVCSVLCSVCCYS